MKKLFAQATVGLLVSGAILSAVAGGPEAPPMVVPGIYFGIGGAWDSYYMKRADTAFVTETATGNAVSSADISRNDTNSKFAPLAQIGFWAPIDSEWLWGLQATYKYLNYTVNDLTAYYTLTVDGAVQSMYDRNIFNNELLLLAYLGVQFDKGYAYLGVGAAMFTARNMLFAFQTVNGTADYRTYLAWENFNRTIWGGAFQVGYNYYFKPTWFLGLNYTYALSGSYSNSVTQPSSAVITNPTTSQTVVGSTKVQLESQEFMFSINKVFEV